MSQNILQAQIKAAQARITYWNALISTGAYKYRKVEVGKGTDEEGRLIFRALTKKELLADTLNILNNHVDNLQRLVDLVR